MSFDHGIDSLSAIFTTPAVVLAMGTNGLKLALALSFVLIRFYFAICEQRYISEMNLGRFNNANEGMVIMVLALLVTAVFGGNFWKSELFGIMLNTWFLIIVVLVNTIIHLFIK